MEFLYKGNNFSSKEISFMKSDSDAIYHSDFTPESYLSDFLIENSQSNNQVATQFNSFVKDILQQIEQNALSKKMDDIKTHRFLCSVIKLEYPSTDNQNSYKTASINSHDNSQMEKNNHRSSKNQKETLVHAINTAVTSEDGLWQWLSESTLITLIWGDTARAEETIKDLIRFADTTLKIKSHAGAALFPFLDFSPTMVICNAIKALDHAAFFAPGTLTFFDDVTQNIYGDRLYQLGKVGDAAREYKQGLEIREDNLNLINSLGVCYSLTNRLELAKEQFEKAVCIYKSSKSQKENFIKTVCNTNEISDTKINKNDDFEADDNQFMIFYNAALTCNLVGDIEKGVEYIKQITTMQKDFFEAELTAGILFLKSDIKDDALIHLNKALKLKPDSAIVHRILGELYLRINLPVKAANEYKQAIKINPYDACSISGLAKVFEIQNKNLDIALTLAHHSLAITPDNPYFRACLGKIYLKKGLYDFAYIEFSKAYMQLKASEDYYKKDGSSDVEPLIFDSSEVEVDLRTSNQDSMEMNKFFEYEDSTANDLKKRSA